MSSRHYHLLPVGVACIYASSSRTLFFTTALNSLNSPHVYSGPCQHSQASLELFSLFPSLLNLTTEHLKEYGMFSSTFILFTEALMGPLNSGDIMQVVIFDVSGASAAGVIPDDGAPGQLVEFLSQGRTMLRGPRLRKHCGAPLGESSELGQKVCECTEERQGKEHVYIGMRECERIRKKCVCVCMCVCHPDTSGGVSEPL